MYKYIYNPNYNNFIDINSKLGKRTLKNYLLSLLGGEITNNKHHLMSSKVRLIYEGSPEYLKKNKKMIDHLTNWQWNMYNTDSKNKNKVRFCTYGLHLPHCPEYGVNGTLQSNDKVLLDITKNLDGILSRSQKPESQLFKLYVKDIKNDKPIERPVNYWELKWPKNCFNSI